MKRWEVTGTYEVVFSAYVEAETADEARQIVDKALSSETGRGDLDLEEIDRVIGSQCFEEEVEIPQ